jgi:L,D-peptidoglycan transpeptidase YkuD (ErfK/YbiS/YcfS/YnhG family)
MIIVNKNGTLIHKKEMFHCAIGKRGIAKKKTEGDQKTPSGVFSLGPVYYRADRIKKLKTKLKKIIIRKNMAWCDNPKSSFYNKLIYVKENTKEKLYRKDHLYDVLVVIKYNMRPIIKNRGSAIFIHIARKNYKGTMGCIALKKKDLIMLLKKINSKTKIKIIA